MLSKRKSIPVQIFCTIIPVI